MIKKTSLQTLSDTNISDEVLIIPEMHREVNDAFIDNAYGDILTETQETQVNVTKGDQISSMLMQFVKQGRKVTIIGWFRQTNGTTVPASWIFRFKDTDLAEYLLPDDSFLDYSGNLTDIRAIATTPNGTSIQIGIREQDGFVGLHSIDSIPPNANTSTGNPSSAFYFTLTYFTKN